MSQGRWDGPHLLHGSMAAVAVGQGLAAAPPGQGGHAEVEDAPGRAQEALAVVYQGSRVPLQEEASVGRVPGAPPAAEEACLLQGWTR